MLTSRRIFLRNCLGTAALAALPGRSFAQAIAAEPRIVSSTKETGYRGIWFTLGQPSEYGDKYSGGLGTYTTKHVPLAIHVPQVQKTFFVYGGAFTGTRHLLAMASYYDHARQVVPQPTIVHDKQGVNDPHDNPSLAIDGSGFLWVFVSGRGRGRPGIIYRSTQPYSTDAFEQISQSEFTYPQPWWIEGQGFLFLFTKYTGVRELYYRTSPDGVDWSPDKKLAGIGGHYQTSCRVGNRVITVFNMHPGGNVDKRTNLYCLQTDDMGVTWRTMSGEAVTLPLTEPQNPALMRDYQAENQLTYLHDLNVDAQGRPVAFFTTSHAHAPGPVGDPRWFTVARWVGDRWEFTPITRANHNYSKGSIYLEDDGEWRIVAPTERGPQPLGGGGEIGIWTSPDQGKTWSKQCDVTQGSLINHNYVRRPVDAHPEFYGFWADGNPDEYSTSSLYFTNKTGDRVMRLPYDMTTDFAQPAEHKKGTATPA